MEKWMKYGIIGFGAAILIIIIVLGIILLKPSKTIETKVIDKETIAGKAIEPPKKEEKTADEIIKEMREAENKTEEILEEENETEEVEEELVGNIIIVDQVTYTGTSGDRKREDISLFEDVKCEKIGEDGELSFSLTNKDTRDYYLGSTKNIDFGEKDPLMVTINGKDKRGKMKTYCGTDTILAGQTITCRNIPVNIKKGVSYYGSELSNNIKAKAVYIDSKLIFRCP